MLIWSDAKIPDRTAGILGTPAQAEAVFAHLLADAKLLEEMVQVAFSQRRKILRNTLGRWLEARGFEGEFDLQRRAEEVPVAEYEALAAQLGPR